MSYIHICPNCKSIFKYPSEEQRDCPDCNIKLCSTGISDTKWNDLSQSEKASIRASIITSNMDQELKKQKNLAQKAKEIIVTTGDLKRDYAVLGPVYFQVSNKGVFGSALGTLKKQYTNEIQEMKQRGTMSADRADWGFLYGEWSVGQNDFEAAFFVATEELKKRAAMVGADAVICMRQDIDMDTNGFAYFYLQMYGTAVKFI